AHLSEPVDTAAMAAACGLGTRTFHREFVRAYGVTPRKYVQLRRIERVRELLRDEGTSVEAAIRRVGVSDLPSFREVFRRELGLSPAEYRRHCRGGG
ncbi:MAG: helix-turn-helix transcriptional regulator, partial [Thermoanaerobaculia bacterium]|nr:helix-turn-helix transcriptional regulator [Thermoanaerobaculia bacterium]